MLFTPPAGAEPAGEDLVRPDGSRSIVVYEDGRIPVDPIALSDAIVIARSRGTRSLTSEECRRYVQSPCVRPPVPSLPTRATVRFTDGMPASV
jgi:hypothetical protein